MLSLAFFAVLALTIDGKLDDPFWKPVTPQTLESPAGGRIRAVVAGRHLYIAAEVPEPTGRVTARSIGRNPAWEDEDLLRISAGATIGYTDRVLHVNPFGAYSLERAGHPVWTSLSVFPYSDEREAPVVPVNIDKFLVATRVGEKGWTAEIAFPLSELSAPGPDTIYAMIERIRAQRPGVPQQVWRWPGPGPAARIPVAPDIPWETPPARFEPPLLGNSEPPLEIGRAGTLPALESKWQDGAWAHAPVWKLLLDEHPLRAPRLATEVKLLHDGRTLAVMARCVEPDGISAEVKENDGAVMQDDSFHVYLATSRSVYVQVVANALGYLRDAAGFSGGSRISRPREWDSGTRVHVEREAGVWTARLDIPLEPVAEVLGESTVPADWRVLLMRFRRGRPGDARETSVLPVIQSDTALCPARYRRLRLAAKATAPGNTQGQAAQTAGTPELALVLTREQRRQMGLATMLDRHIRARVRKHLEADRDEWNQVNSRGDWERFRNPRLNAMRAWMGEFPARTPLEASVTKEYRGHGYRRQDLVYRSRPGLWVTANLYLPEKPSGQLPGIVIVHSHHRPRTQAELQDMGILWARQGAAVLIMDQIGHGERIQTYPWNREGYRSRYSTGMQLYVAGESLIKWMVWDIMRGIDLLLERPDIDREKIIMLGAVAGGGDPAAVTAALDPRIAAVAPFTFGESLPELGPGGSPFPSDLAVPGWGSWETTRNLPHSIGKRFFPWTICASVAPRRFVYSYEMGWEVEKVPAWARYRKVFGFYNALDNLDEAHGFGTFPGPGECANIGPAQRKTLYPELERWFGIPIPDNEPDDRRPEAELAALTVETAAKLDMRMIHQLASEIAEAKLKTARAELARMDSTGRRKWLQQQWAAKLGDIHPNPAPKAIVHWMKPSASGEAEGITLDVESGITVPLVLLKASTREARQPVAIVVSQGGKEQVLAHHRAEIDRLLAAGIAVCLPDVRGVGETSPDPRRFTSSQNISLAATELMLGNTLPGARLKDLRTVLKYLQGRQEFDPQRIAVWGGSGAPVNKGRLLLDETPGWLVGPEIQHQAEPLGGLLAILAGLYEDSVKAVAVRRGLAAYLSLLEDRFTYVPSDVVFPGIAEIGDIADLAAVLSPRPLLLDGLVDGRNRAVSEPELRATFSPTLEAYRGQPEHLRLRATTAEPGVAEWLIQVLGR
ncbi:MAG TPA: acetylxylan esterase [Bryobacteraceae bacterium]|nr:acetylxylan esterase [Bryobacteraceae bacterium]